MNESPTNHAEADLERDLRRLTAAGSRPADLVARARHRAAVEASGGTGRLARISAGWRIGPVRLLAGAAAIVIAALGLSIMVQALDPGAVRSAMAPHASVVPGDGSVSEAFRSLPRDAPAASMPLSPPPPSPPLPGGGAGDPDAGRHIVRQASIEIRTADVAAAFQRVQLLVREGQGEFIADSSQQGLGLDERASVTLRVAATRVGEVLASVRDLGGVVAEARTGDDVTDRVVDLDARLRNEQRVEEELLELLRGRADAPLDDILQLRHQLGEVRGAIERLEGQRSVMRQLVSLATVVVLIRMDPDAVDPALAEDGSMAARFGERVGDAWTMGLVALMDSVAGLLRVVVGGLLWWIAAVAIVLFLARRFGRG